MRDAVFSSAKKLLFAALCIGTFATVAVPQHAFAATSSVRINGQALTQGYTVDHKDGLFRMAVTTQHFADPVRVTIQNSKTPPVGLPAGLDAVSSFVTVTAASLEGVTTNPSAPLSFTLKATTTRRYAEKTIYTLDPATNAWVALPTTVALDGSHASAAVSTMPATVVLLENGKRFVGQASWYGSAKRTAASNDYPYGTKLRVTDAGTKKSVVVTVVSTGPFVTGRVIDLSRDAFAALLSPSEGVTHVYVEPWVAPVGAEAAKQPWRPNPPHVDARSAIVVDAASGEALSKQRSKDVHSLASITKLMTALVVLDAGLPFDQVVTMDKADQVGGARLTVRAGESLTVKQLFNAMLVGSANNAAKALARATGMSHEQFIAAMNAKAVALGMTTAVFTEPSGLDPKNIGSARDVALLARAAFRQPEVLAASTTRAYGFTTKDGGAHRIKNTNKLLKTDLRITGGKTGYLDEIGYSLAVKAKNKTTKQEFIAVVLGTTSPTVQFGESEKLLRWALE